MPISGNEDGWCENSKMVWIRKKVKVALIHPCFEDIQFCFYFQGNLDYHQDMDGTNFNKWAEEAFRSLPPRSVIVMVKMMFKAHSVEIREFFYQEHFYVKSI